MGARCSISIPCGYKAQLKKINASDLTDFSFENIETIGKVISVYDGDTCRIAFKYDTKIIMMSCRLAGIDSPEIRNKDLVAKQKAIEARDYLKTLVMNADNSKLVNIKLGKFDKYGRPLVVIFVDGENINMKMANEGHAVLYDGGTKIK